MAFLQFDNPANRQIGNLVIARMLSRLRLLVLLCMIPISHLKAQKKNDTLKTVNIRAKHTISEDIRLNNFSSGQKIQTIDSTTLKLYSQQSIATLLSQQLPVFVKSYSFNGLATLNFRGASAAQSAVLWNGVPIQNAALGVADVSSLPVLFMKKVNIVYGGSGALYGSGNVGGALLLENDKPSFDSSDNHVSVSGGAGSFGQYSFGAVASTTVKRLFLSTSILSQSAHNDYRYTNATGIEQKMSNARLTSTAAMLRAAYKANQHNIINLSLWTQQYTRQIPPALFEASSVKKQQDKALRLVADWQHEQDRYTLYAKSSLMRDSIIYTDNAVQVATANSVYQYYQELGWKQQVGTFGQLLLFAPVQLSWLPGGNDTQRQNRIALVAAYTTKPLNGRLTLSAQARAELINNANIFLPGAGAAFRITDWLSARANVQRTYRMPSLNELYYFPGGNARLKPEQGWNEDAGYSVKAKKNSFTLYHDVSVFNRKINDWILWLGGAVWTPHNIATVHSRGIETDNKITYSTGNWQLHAAAGTAYIIATAAASYLPNDGSIGKQIPYTPRYNGRLNAGCTYKRLYLNYNHSYTGYRFITTDESAYLLPYHTGNIHAMYTLPIRKCQLELTTQINNVWNEQYAIAGFRPMPGTNWLTGIKFGF